MDEAPRPPRRRQQQDDELYQSTVDTVRDLVAWRRYYLDQEGQRWERLQRMETLLSTINTKVYELERGHADRQDMLAFWQKTRYRLESLFTVSDQWKKMWWTIMTSLVLTLLTAGGTIFWTQIRRVPSTAHETQLAQEIKENEQRIAELTRAYGQLRQLMETEFKWLRQQYPKESLP